MSNTSSSTTIANNAQENEVLAHRFHTKIFQKAKFSLTDEILTPDFVLHNPVLASELTKGPVGVKRFASGVVDSLADLHTLVSYRFHSLLKCIPTIEDCKP